MKCISIRRWDRNESARWYTNKCRFLTENQFLSVEMFQNRVECRNIRIVVFIFGSRLWTIKVNIDKCVIFVCSIDNICSYT